MLSASKRDRPSVSLVTISVPTHPQFLALQQKDPETASSFAQMDAGRWTEKLLKAAAERQVNIVFETTMRIPDNVARVIGMARDAR
jgi:hypothetical protein